MAKYEADKKDNVREQLLKLAQEISGETNETSDVISYKNIDITGSLGCWGIVQQ